MSRGPSTFRQHDVKSAIRAVVSAGLGVDRVEVDKAGKIVVFIGQASPEPSMPTTIGTGWEDVR
jgi:hypothetical protein